MKRLESYVDEVIALINQRAYDAAAEMARQLVEAEPNVAMNLHVYGLALLSQGHPEQAVEAFNRAVAIDATNPATFLKRGDALMACQRHVRALKSYEQAIQLSPKFAVAFQGMGDATMALGDLARAEKNYELALSLNEGLHDAMLGLSAVQLQKGDADAALRTLESLLGKNPKHALAWGSRGSIAYQLGRFEDAIESYQRAIELKPDFAPMYDNLGMAFMALGRPEDAIAQHSKAIELAPDFAIAWSRRAMAKRSMANYAAALEDADVGVQKDPGNAMALNIRGIIQGDLGRFVEAQQDLRAAIQAAPDVPEFWNNIGSVLIDRGHYERAVERLDRAIELRWNYAEAHSNRGLAMQNLRKFDFAENAFDQAIKHAPRFPEAYKRRANLKLLQGDFQQGWQDYQNSLNMYRPKEGAQHAIPRWEGQSLLGKSILLSEPNGFGDLFQFWRYVPNLIAMGADVFFLGAPRIFRLLQSSEYNVRYLEQFPEGKQFDYRAELWTLPMALGTDAGSIPDGVPYLHAEKDRLETWQRILPLSTRNVGIFWQGSTKRWMDQSRFLQLADLLPLAEVPGVRLVSLQQGAGVEQIDAAKADMRLIVPDESRDADYAFLDTAALIQRLDLVVTVDSAIAHLAGTMGRPTWVALKHVPDWRWGLEGDASPWYPQTRLFRQPRLGDWATVIADMRDALLTRRSAR